MMISYFFLLVSVSVGLGFFTLLERKVLGYIQDRKGPTKVGEMGLLQPFSDGLKLFSKESNWMIFGNFFLFSVVPMLGLVLCFVSWMLFIIEWDLMDFDFLLLIFLCLSSFNVYIIVMSGWSSSSMYAILGSYRGIAQMISYEVVMSLLMMLVVVLGLSYEYNNYKEGGIFLLCILVFFVWFSTMLAETNRSPYDFAEGESELVSGFNVEYSSIGFSMLFMAEYGNILFICYVSGLMFFGEVKGIFMIIFSFLFVWIRGSFPRVRYDSLMSSAWKYYLYFVLSYFMFLLGVEGLVEMNLV